MLRYRADLLLRHGRDLRVRLIEALLDRLVPLDPEARKQSQNRVHDEVHGKGLERTSTKAPTHQRIGQIDGVVEGSQVRRLAQTG